MKMKTFGFQGVQMMDELNKEAILEGLLYVVGDEGIKEESISSIMEISIEDTRALLKNIENKYADENFGIELVNYGKTYKFVTKNTIYPYVQKLLHNEKVASLSNAALETLAIIAYKQPITRIEIEELRGVGCDMMLRKLESRDLIKEAGRSDAPGKPILYEVTEEFLNSFKLETLGMLPELPKFNDENSDSDLFD